MAKIRATGARAAFLLLLTAGLLIVGPASLPAEAQPSSSGYAASDGVEIYYHTFGEGPPLLLLNGGPGLSSIHFVPLAERLGDRHRVILFDQRGTGRSTLETIDGSSVRLDLMVEDIEAVRTHLGIASWTVMGHSWGGMYAMAYATEHEARVERLILSSSGGSDLEWLDYVGANIRMRLGPTERETYDYWTSAANVRREPERASRERVRAVASAYVYFPENRDAVVAALSNDDANEPRVRGLVYADLRRIGFDLSEELRRFTKPTLLVHGRQDILGELVPQKTHEALPNSRLVWLNECSHYPWLDQPGAFFEALDTFFQETAPER